MSENAVLTLDEFVRLYPWPEDARAGGTPLEYLWHFDLDAPTDDLWVHLADTSRFNRALGVSEMQFEERDGALVGRSRNGGLLHEWVEDPWDWVAGQFFLCVRRYSRGFARLVRGIYHFEPQDAARVRLYVYFGWIPRGALGALALRLGMPSIGRGYRRLLDRLIRELAQARPEIYHLPPPPLPPDTLTRVSAIGQQLRERGFRAAAVDKLVDLVCAGDDMDLYRLQVLALSREWGMAEDELLRMFLHATRLGLLDMSWDVICPHCRGVREEARHLGDVPVLGSCAVCEIDFTTDKENAVEITFHVHPSIRAVPKRHFCSAEPASKLHVKLQRAVPAGERESVRLDLQPGRYRIRLAGQERHRFLDVIARRSAPADATDRDAAIPDGGRAAGARPGEVVWTASGDGELESGPELALVLHNDADAPHTFVLETATWADVALRPARLFNLQEFRDLFSEEYLSADLQLSVGEQTIVFTDIVGSTRFYATRGDPAAFVEVKKHFAEIFAIVAKNHGAVIKTIGDAVMAAFSNPVDALITARQIHECFHADRQDTPIRVRVSVNTGACIAVNFNSGIDYFGSTVNLAAKLQACADAGEIALSEATYEAPGVAEFLAGAGTALERVTLESKTIGDAVPARRWRIHGPSDRPTIAASSRPGYVRG